ncbi:serine/threonine-protein phosphatase 4 regulatory subunit 4-like isoform X2 [Macrosteles quadrilineatus]|uniref:serine/threonine-protein phosphatase 4 regulatory subunit 4-like isoform X2 n=1 Tax=Macrosteles quadrilineatus TaxID=74068 RepID=UPI0023E306E4|nr:serine/threonine-protein phosphatase 4 regulatory subunit 4-like isoform X2 [Macrosteles quadrilineatus]
MTNDTNMVGDELQKISVMKNLPNLIREDLTACLQRVIPRMQQTLLYGTTEYNMGACEAVRTITTQSMVSPDDTKVFLHHILVSLESRDTVAAEEWLNVLLDIIQVLPVSMLQNEVLPMAVNKAHISKPVPVRITSCKILGKLALSFSPFLVKKDIVPVVIALCQDVSGDVRAEMSKLLPSVATTLGLETGNCLLNHVLDLISDEEVIVRAAAIEAVANMLNSFSQEILKNTIIPLTKKVFTEIMKNEDNLLLVLSKFYGQYAIGLRGVMSGPDKTQFLQRYVQLSQLNANTKQKLNPYKPIVVDEEEMALRLTECRLNCAYNYPAMMVFVSDMKQEVLEMMFSVFKSLASDSFCQVRKKIAAGFYEVMKMMPKWHSALKTEFIKLLKDGIDIVLEGLVPNISNILLGFAASGNISADKPESGKDVGQALFICEKNLNDSFRWRLHEEVLLAFRAVPKIFHHEFVYTYFVPLLMTRASNGRILPCRVAALHTLSVIIVDPSQSKQKHRIRDKILELCNNSSFHCRLLFLRGMEILQTLSPDVLKELFFHHIISMAEDKVPNIRLMVCKLLPKLKGLASDPVDRKLLACVDACVNTLSDETDRDVLAQLRSALREMDDIEKCKAGMFKKNAKKAAPAPTEVVNMNISQVPSINIMKADTPLTDMRSTDSLNSRGRNTVMSSYSVARQSPAASQISSLNSTSSNSGPFTRAQSARPSPRTPRPSTSIKKPPGLNKLSTDEFLVDAGIPLKSTTAVMKRIPTPRPVHKPMNAVETYKDTQHKSDTRDGIEKGLQYSPMPERACSTLTNKNLNVTNRPSSLPVKKMNFKPLTFKPLTKEEIEKELMQTDSRPYSPRSRLKNTPKPNKLDKKENKRLSLDPTELSYAYSRMETRSSNLNKRMSMDVDSKKDLENRKTYLNNNFLTPKMGSTRSGIVRPQSCVLQGEKVNYSKRSMSVENLPPKVTRLASRLPVRANNDPKQTKPK